MRLIYATFQAANLKITIRFHFTSIIFNFTTYLINTLTTMFSRTFAKRAFSKASLESLTQPGVKYSVRNQLFING